jgi:lipoate-protein ligase A
MLRIINPSDDPYFNMAMEDYLVHTADITEDIFMLWQNRPTVVVGRHQNSSAEINLPYVRENNIAVVRRLSGGGAVYHDQGNLNFTFVSRIQGRGFDFAAFTMPVIEVLRQLGVAAEYAGRNDIVIAGRKFSGNAQYRFKDRLMHHGTILWDSNLEDVAQALQPDECKTVARGIASVRSRVTNISEHLPRFMTLKDFTQLLAEHLFRHSGEKREREFSGQELNAIGELRAKKYSTWEWNYGQSPQYTQRRKAQFPWGSMEAFLLVEQGKVAQCRYCGDFFNIGHLSDLEAAIINQPLQPEAITAALQSLDPGTIIPGATAEQIASLLID